MSAPHRVREAVAFYRIRRGELVVYMKGCPALQCRNGPTLRNGLHVPFTKNPTTNLTPRSSYGEDGCQIHMALTSC